MASYHIQTNLTLNLIRDIVLKRNTISKRHNQLAHHIAKLNEYAQVVASESESTDPNKVWPGIRNNELRLYVFDTVMLIETLSRAVENLENKHALYNSDVRYWLLRIVEAFRDTEVLKEDYHSSLDEVQQTVEKAKEELDLLQSGQVIYHKTAYRKA